MRMKTSFAQNVIQFMAPSVRNVMIALNQVKWVFLKLIIWESFSKVSFNNFKAKLIKN
jgi:hypothetical protein